MTTPAKLYVQCNPLLDISAQVDDAFMAKYKLLPGSAALIAEEQKDIFADLERMPGLCYVPGGAGLNSARVAQWLLQAPRGSCVTFVGCIAPDRYGGILRDRAEGDGVVMAVELTARAPTGSCAVCITGKERALVANLAAANCLSEEYMYSKEVLQHIEAAKLFYFTGFTLVVDEKYVLYVAKKAQEAGSTFMLNLSAPYIIEVFGERLNQVLPYVDVIFANEMEAVSLAKAHNWNTENVKEIATRVIKDIPYSGSKERIVLFTQGDRPTICASKSEMIEVPVEPLKQDEMVDLNGAGDAFVGGFLSAYAVGKDLRRCCEVGHYAARVVIQHDGCTFPDKPEISP